MYLKVCARGDPAIEVRGDGARALYDDPKFRQTVKDELAMPVRRIFAGDWDKVEVLL